MGESNDRREKVMANGSVRWQKGKNNGKRRNNDKKKVCNGRREKVMAQGRKIARREGVTIEGKK
jgi:hypothetical protein